MLKRFAITLLALLALLALFLWTSSALAAVDVYVVPDTDTACNDYDHVTMTCGGGSSKAIKLSGVQTEINNYSYATHGSLNIYFKRGATFTFGSPSGLTLNKQNIKLSSFGSGAKPVLDGNYAQGSMGTIITIISPFCTVENLEITKGSFNAIAANHTASSGYYGNNLTVKDCLIHNHGNQAIYLLRSSNCVIERVEAYSLSRASNHGDSWFWTNVNDRRTQPFGTGLGGATSGTNNVVRYCKVSSTAGEGITLMDGIIEYNVVSGTSSTSIYGDRWLSTNSNIIIRYNLIHGDSDSVYRGGSISINDERTSGDNASSSVEIYGNILVGGAGIRLGLITEDGVISPLGSLKVYNNAFVDCGGWSGSPTTMAIVNPNKILNAQVKNNAFIYSADYVGTISNIFAVWSDNRKDNTVSTSMDTWAVGPNFFYGKASSDSDLPSWARNADNVFGTVHPLPKASGWRSLTSDAVFSFADLYPASTSEMINSGKAINLITAGKEYHMLLTTGTEPKNTLLGSGAEYWRRIQQNATPDFGAVIYDAGTIIDPIPVIPGGDGDWDAGDTEGFETEGFDTSEWTESDTDGKINPYDDTVALAGSRSLSMIADPASGNVNKIYGEHTGAASKYYQVLFRSSQLTENKASNFAFIGNTTANNDDVIKLKLVGASATNKLYLSKTASSEYSLEQGVGGDYADSYAVDSSTRQYLTCKFTVGASGYSVARVVTAMRVNGTPAYNITAKIFSHNAGANTPDAQVGSDSNTVAAPTSNGDVTLDFSAPIALSSTTVYWLVLYHSNYGASTDRTRWEYDANVGRMMQSADAATWLGSRDNNARFTLYSVSAAPTDSSDYFNLLPDTTYKLELHAQVNDVCTLRVFDTSNNIVLNSNSAQDITLTGQDRANCVYLVFEDDMEAGGAATTYYFDNVKQGSAWFTSGGTPAETPSYAVDQPTKRDGRGVGRWGNDYMVGPRSEGNFSGVTAIGVKLSHGAGDISGKTFAVEIWSTVWDETEAEFDLDTKKYASTNVGGSNGWDGDFVKFIFPNAFNLGVGDVPVVTMNEVDGSNYAVYWTGDNATPGFDYLANYSATGDRGYSIGRAAVHIYQQTGGQIPYATAIGVWDYDTGSCVSDHATVYTEAGEGMTPCIKVTKQTVVVQNPYAALWPITVGPANGEIGHATYFDTRIDSVDDAKCILFHLLFAPGMRMLNPTVTQPVLNTSRFIDENGNDFDLTAAVGALSSVNTWGWQIPYNADFPLVIGEGRTYESWEDMRSNISLLPGDEIALGSDLTGGIDTVDARIVINGQGYRVFGTITLDGPYNTLKNVRIVPTPVEP